MRQLPQALKQFTPQALKYLREGRVSACEFSGPTYQVQVFDEEYYWVFLQLGKLGEITDAFCSCVSDEEEGKCIHIAVAYLSLFKGDDGIPLHQRFARSLWNFLCRIYAEKAEYSIDTLKKKGPYRYAWTTSSGKDIFTMQSKNQYLLDELIIERKEETEETSLKFSNLTSEEIEMWRQGKPTDELKYELSFWSDLAKWMMIQQERDRKYHIDFSLSPEGVPNRVHISWDDLQAEFYLSRANLPQMIPFLSTVDSPLKVYGVDEGEIEQIAYDEIKGTLNIVSRSRPKKYVEEIKGSDIGNWIFVPGDGFYAKKHHSLLGEKTLKGDEIIWAFEEHFNTLQKNLQGTPIYEDPVKAQYKVYFDDDLNLHIETYVNEVGDVNKPYSRQYGSWYYLQGNGFYRVEDHQFINIVTVVSSDEVVSFIVQNRAWLNTQPGYHTFLSSIETYLTYTVNERGKLCFESSLEGVSFDKTAHDFGRWVYVPDEGFYQKSMRYVGLPIVPGTCLEPQDVAPLIRMYREELKNVPCFFSDRSPIHTSGLHITINKEGNIVHELRHDRFPEYEKARLIFYTDYVYTPGEGFHELPLPPGFPKEYCETRTVVPDAEEVFILFDLPHLKPYATYIDPKLSTPGLTSLVAEEVKSKGSGWFNIIFKYRTEIGVVDAVEVWKAIKEKRQFLFSNGGVLNLDDDRFRWMRQIDKKKIDVKSNAFILSSLDMLRLNSFETISSENKILREILEFTVPEEPNIQGLRSQLRPYQENGLKWLWYLYKHNLSGLLCDDMGLGKTHQAMALMAAALNESDSPMHFLVVSPTSVIYHWQDKLHTYLPEMRVCTFYGSKRSMEGFHHEYDLLLTSYGIWRREKKLLGNVPFEIAIFDEIQMAKNRKSMLHASLLQANARFRLGMTGTPIENRLQELKALFDIVLPGYMPGEEEYANFFVKPIERRLDRNKQAILSRFIKPFVLRRKKEDVLTDLPEKIEEVSYCALLPEQKKLYQAFLEASRKEIVKQLDDRDKSIPFVHVFALLSRLKQICDHPAVLYKKPEHYKEHTSGKWDLFIELLHEALDSKQKIVVFSQFLAQLDIIETYLKEHNIEHAGIRGSTIERGEEIKRFQTDPNCEVFVASLQAGGLGIDLTAASVVIHYDRWWNAARENQATDRVHRIGQSRGVQVFKLVTRGTFEEKIHEMILRKAKLMEEVVGVDDQQMIKQLDRKEILELLQDVHFGAEDQQDIIQDIE